MRIILCVILITFSVSAYTQEIRTGTIYSLSLNPSLDIQIKYQKRLYNSGTLMNYSDIYQVSGSRKIFKDIIISSSVRYSEYDQQTNMELGLKEYNDKFRYCFDLNYETKREKGYKHKFRLRYQHADLNNQKRNDHLRIKYAINYKISDFYQFKTSPEIFYRLDKDRLNAIRLTMSTQLEISKLSIELFYTMERHWKMKNFEYFNIIGITLHFNSANKK